jgi:hypothetical protein
MFFSTIESTFIEEVQDIIPASVSITRAKLWPFIEQAERKYVKPLLGDTLYQDLNTFYNNRSSWSSGSDAEDAAKTTELLRLLRIAELNLALLVGFPVLNSVISDTGFQRTESENVKGLYKYQETELKKYFESAGFNGLDDMLSYIEENIEHFPEWEDSQIYQARKTSLIKDAIVFDEICYINRSRLTFLRLQRYITEVMDLDIKPLLGDEYATLMSELAKEDPQAEYSAMAVEIRKPLAYLSCAKLIEKTGNLEDRGLFFEGKNSMYPDDSVKRSATADEIASSVRSYREMGEKYMEALRQYLTLNGFIQTGSVAGGVYNRDNTNKKIFIA